MSTWREEYQGDAESERLLFDRLALDMMQVQLKTRKSSKAAGIKRAFHSKGVFAAVDGVLKFVDDLPEDLRAGQVHIHPQKTKPPRFPSGVSVDLDLLLSRSQIPRAG